MTNKRKCNAFSAHEKMVHKSCTLLQREIKKVRKFMVRRMVQQLKKLQQQRLEPAQDAVKQQKRDHKLRHGIERLERKHLALKMLDLGKVVTRARLKTGLSKPRSQGNKENAHEGELSVEDSDEKKSKGSRQEAGNEDKVDTKNVGAAMMKTIITEEKQVTIDQEKNQKDDQHDTVLEEELVDSLLAHKQIVPLLEVIQKLVLKKEKDAAKKWRAQEKRALKRSRHESLVGNTGRSGVVPTSLFLGSLSGRGRLNAGEESSSACYGTMASADDDIAEFLGEKKKKNRPGQTARRMKAIREEEALKRKENSVKGSYVDYRDKSASIGKYGLSERPKKAKMKIMSDKKDKPGPGGVKPRVNLMEVELQKQRTISAFPVEAAHPSWLAKQKQKKKEKISLTAFSGKKITF